MMTYLKNMGGYKQSQLKAKTFVDIQGLYERQKRVIDDFKPIESDDAIKDSKEAAGVNKQEVFKEPNSTKVEVKQEGHEKSIKKRFGRRLKMKATKKSKRQKTDADLEEGEQLKAYLKIVNEEGIIDYEVLEKRFPIINWESKFYDFDRHGTKCIYYRIFRSDGSSRWIKTFSKMVTKFDRLDLVELYNLVIKRFKTTTPEEDELWQNQERWNLKSWDFYENCGVHTLILEDGTEIHILVERKYPFTKETLERMLSLRLVVGTASKDAYTLLRFIQKQIDEYGSHDGEKTASGKDFLNPLIADNLLKTIWFSTHHASQQIRNEDLHTELGYFSKEYDKEREMKPRPEQNKETTPPLRMRSPRVRRQRERVVGFEEAPNREEGRIERNVKGGGPSELRAKENGSQGLNLPPLLAAHLGISENG
ncbi:hypothetical protein Tco_0725097 [Tanacetum coccineum]|uniref:Uncharacterized protein n=1 Tax=Tanacetum coccineum TaxID=301880 RepID=A0ABQ4YCZ2_9ASTR